MIFEDPIPSLGDSGCHLWATVYSQRFLRVRASIAIARISYGNSVCPSRPGTDSRPRQIESSGFHLEPLVFCDKISRRWV